MRLYGWKWSPGQGIGFGAFDLGRRGRFFESGEVRLAILSLLSEGPKHGYQLMKEMEERSGGMYKASAGTIYPTLQQLEDEDLIEVERENGKKIFRLTAAGRGELAQDPETVKRIWERAGQWDDWGQHMGPHAGGVIGPAMQVVRSALRAARCSAGRPEREEKIRRILDRVGRELNELERDWK